MEIQAALRPSRSIQEFRIDFILEEEFSVSLQFAKDFIAACGASFVPERIDRVVHSLNDAHGEADLAVLVVGRSPAGDPGKFALLIEDKINASLQPNQAERYRRRGQDGVENTLWDNFLTILVAPHAYISSQHGFDAAIPLEQIREWISSENPRRRMFKCQKIDEAIKKQNTSGVQIVDDNMTVFRTAYYNYRQDFNVLNGTDFEMRRPAPTYSGDVWVTLKSAQLPPGAEFRHRMESGWIELIFKDIDFEKVQPLKAFLDQEGIVLIATGKRKQHTTMQLSIPKISAFYDFAQERPKVEAAFQSAVRLQRLVQHEWAHFNKILTAAHRK
jgi:hypothetical protein